MKMNLQIQTRDEFPELINKLNLKIGAEIGIARGRYSRRILKHSNLKILYSIDSWIKEPKEVDKLLNGSQFMHSVRYLETVFRLLFFKTRSAILRMKSEDAVKMFEDDGLDFVYIDAVHSYKGCKKDIDLWYPKLKKGGLFSGHDYMDGFLSKTKFEVKKAVDEFVKEKKLKLFTTKESICPSWYFIKE